MIKASTIKLKDLFLIIIRKKLIFFLLISLFLSLSFFYTKNTPILKKATIRINPLSFFEINKLIPYPNLISDHGILLQYQNEFLNIFIDKVNDKTFLNDLSNLKFKNVTKTVSLHEEKYLSFVTVTEADAIIFAEWFLEKLSNISLKKVTEHSQVKIDNLKKQYDYLMFKYGLNKNNEILIKIDFLINHEKLFQKNLNNQKYIIEFNPNKIYFKNSRLENKKIFFLSFFLAILTGIFWILISYEFKLKK